MMNNEELYKFFSDECEALYSLTNAQKKTIERLEKEIKRLEAVSTELENELKEYKGKAEKKIDEMCETLYAEEFYNVKKEGLE